ncbi:MAG: histidine phosphatase family protein [Rhodanobacteraceae bacterium]|nr:histidine phosphatase family protein [Rhodanobacteraceae bacterium]
MSSLLLIRHGQAGATTANYDELSPLGHAQAARLGEWLAAHRREFGAVYVGRLKRQQQTLAGIAGAYAAAGQALPTAEDLAELDEYRFVDLVRSFAASDPKNPDLLHWMAHPDDRAHWPALLRATLLAWAAGEIGGIEEDYAAFRARIRRAREKIEARMAQGPVLAVTSAGVISHFLQSVLGMPTDATIDINLGIANTALSEYRLTRLGLKLATLNALPHLSAPGDAGMITLV